jgi:hypothetical protein
MPPARRTAAAPAGHTADLGGNTMRRLVAVATLAAGLALAGCGGDTKSSATPTASPSAGPTASPSPAIDPKAAAICDDLRNNVLDVDAKAFGAELGKMIVARTQGKPEDAAKSQQAAVDKLHTISGKLRARAGEASDPKLKTALTSSADNLDQLAADSGNFTSLDSLDKVGQTTQRYAAATGSIGEYCA